MALSWALCLVFSTWNPHKRLRQIGILYYVFTAIMFPFVLELFRSTAYREHKIIQQSRPRKKLSEFCKKSLFIRQRNLNLNTMKSGILLMGNPRLKRKSDSVILTQDKQIDEMKGKRGEFLKYFGVYCPISSFEKQNNIWALSWVSKGNSQLAQFLACSVTREGKYTYRVEVGLKAEIPTEI